LAWTLFVRDVVLSDATTGGYASVLSTGQLQSDTYAIQSTLGVSLLDEARTGRLGEIADLVAAVDDQVATIASEADSAREAAAAQTLDVRWDRYRATIDRTVDAGRRGDTAQAVGLLRGEALADFNGFNTAIESVLVDNRDQFLTGSEQAGQAVEYLPWIVLVLGVLAAVLSALGIQQRRQDYR